MLPMWNVKQKDDGMGQNTFHYCYDNHVPYDYESASLNE